jgi:ABC exporter DevB family membrane fusion protein
MRPVLFTVLILLAAVGGWFLGARFGPQPAPPSSTDEVAVDALPNSPSTIFGQGKLVPASGLINIVAQPGERVVKMTDKKIGDEVSKDEVLVTLYSRVLRERDLELARARRADALKNVEFEKQQAAYKLKSAQLALDEANASDRKIDDQAQAIDLLRIQLEDAQQLLERLQNLRSNPATKDLVNQTDIEKQTLLVKQVSWQIEQAEMEVKTARESAARAKELAQNNLNTIQYSIANSDEAVPLKSLDAAVALAQQAYEMTEIHSPIDHATIVDIVVREGNSVTNQPIMVLADVSQMDCVVEVVDSFLKSIDVEKYKNLRARITGSALKQPLTGTVIAKGIMIGPVSLKDPNPFARVDQRTGIVTVRLDDPASAAKFVNLQVNVEIEVEPGTFKKPEANATEQDASMRN